MAKRKNKYELSEKDKKKWKQITIFDALGINAPPENKEFVGTIYKKKKG